MRSNSLLNEGKQLLREIRSLKHKSDRLLTSSIPKKIHLHNKNQQSNSHGLNKNKRIIANSLNGNIELNKASAGGFNISNGAPSNPSFDSLTDSSPRKNPEKTEDYTPEKISPETCKRSIIPISQNLMPIVLPKNDNSKNKIDSQRDESLIVHQNKHKMLEKNNSSSDHKSLQNLKSKISLNFNIPLIKPRTNMNLSSKQPLDNTINNSNASNCLNSSGLHYSHDKQIDNTSQSQIKNPNIKFNLNSMAHEKPNNKQFNSNDANLSYIDNSVNHNNNSRDYYNPRHTKNLKSRDPSPKQKVLLKVSKDTFQQGILLHSRDQSLKDILINTNMKIMTSKVNPEHFKLDHDIENSQYYQDRSLVEHNKHNKSLLGKDSQLIIPPLLKLNPKPQFFIPHNSNIESGISNNLDKEYNNKGKDILSPLRYPVKTAKWILTDEEKQLYGDRFPDDYQKIDFLGRGGFALVWLGMHCLTGQKVAIKQMLKSHSTESQKRELYYGQYLFGIGGIPKEELKLYNGFENIIKFIDLKSTKFDTWLIMELGGSTLSKLLFEIKGEFFKGERVYAIKHMDLFYKFQKDFTYLRSFIKDMANILHLLSDCKIIHSDLKPENILIEMVGTNNTSQKLFKLKIIDFGSAYTFNQHGSLGMITPEYMPPEVLELLMNPNHVNKTAIEVLAQRSQTWSVDVWSLGVILLEILTGIPVWLSFKCKVEVSGKQILKTGLFSAKGRTYDRIIVKQRAVLENLNNVLDKYINTWSNEQELIDLISCMMRWDPLKRISPIEILNHPYMTKQ